MMVASLWVGTSGRTLAAPPQHEEIPQVKMINESMAAVWADNSLKPSPIEDDSIWARRVYLDLIGRIPNLAELSEFMKDKEQGRRMRLVDKLLGDEYTEEFANHWAMIWSNILIGRAGGTGNNTLNQSRRHGQILARLVRSQQALQPDGARVDHGQWVDQAG